MARSRWSRRTTAKLLAAAVCLPALLRGHGARAGGARVAVVGGGFAGSATAGTIKALAPEIDVVLLAPEKQYYTCPGSNSVIAGLAGMDSLAQSYDGLRRAGVRVIHAAASAVDVEARRVRVDDGSEIPYDRLVLAPGIEFVWDGIEGLSAETTGDVPHAWRAGDQTRLLRRQLEAMPEDGLFVLSMPVGPFRCPPGTGERLSLIAHYFQQHKPKAKIVALDAKPHFSLQEQFMTAWATLYPGMIDYHLLEDDGVVRIVEPKTRKVFTDFDEYDADVVNVIPPQRAGAIARAAGVVDHTGWCPVDPASMRSTVAEHVYVVGDSALAPPLPKAASAAVRAAGVCAADIVRDLRGTADTPQKLGATCFALAAPHWGFSISGTLDVRNGGLVLGEDGMHVTPTDAPITERAEVASRAASWHDSITQRVWGTHTD